MTVSASCARGESATFTSATTCAPADLAISALRSRSGLLPDCEIAMNSAPSSCGVTAYTEPTDGDADAVTRPSVVSNRYLPYVAAWSELPRAQVTMKRGG